MKHINIINIVSSIENLKVIWGPLIANKRKENQYIFSEHPVNAHYHVIFNVLTKLTIPNVSSRICFIVTEPPEIQKLDLKFLQQFGTIFSPHFAYLENLPNVKFVQGLYSHQAGYNVTKDFKENIPVSKMPNFWSVERPILLSAITSTKVQTKFHIQRLEFIKYLKNEITGFEVFGRGFSPVEDKAQILLKSRYHLALENSIHKGWWTEKLIDPLICGSQIFWSGDESVKKLFESVVTIDLTNFKRAKQIIELAIKEDIYLKNHNKRYDEYLRYFNDYNIFSVIESWIDSFKNFEIESLNLIKIKSMTKKRKRVLQSLTYRFKRLLRNF